MKFDPTRILRRWRSFRAKVDQEVSFLIDQYGDDALKAARERMKSADLRSDQKRLLAAAIRQLGK